MFSAFFLALPSFFGSDTGADRSVVALIGGNGLMTASGASRLMVVSKL